MLYERQKKLLALLTTFGGSVEKTDFMKYLFLYSLRESGEKFYDFVPCQYGPFSFTAYEDREALMAEGYLFKNDSWQITQAGRMAAGKTDLFMKSFFDAVKHLKGEELIRHIYQKYPYFAINSTTLDKFNDKTLKQAVIEKRQAITPVCSMNTIGYKGHSVDSYFGKLIASGVTILCDVRKNPLSRKRGFSKASLSNYARIMNIFYEHMPELGIDSDKRKDLKTQSDYDRLFHIYEEEVLRKQTKALQKIESWIEGGEIVALTCYERLPGQCHRRNIANFICKAQKIERPNHL